MSVKHTRIGVWDLYEDKTRAAPRSRSSYARIVHSAPYVVRMITDIASIRDCWFLLAAYLVVELAASLVPALALSFSGRLLSIVSTAVDERRVDTDTLITVAAGGVLCSLASRVLRYTKQRLTTPLHVRIKLHYSAHIFHAMARLDVPTFDDPAVQRQIEHALPRSSHSSTAFDAVSATLRVITTAIQLTSQLSVLLAVIANQPDGPLLAVLSFGHAFVQWNQVHKPFISDGIWAATTTDQDYIRSEGLKRVVNNPIYRKELVAANLAPFLLSEYKRAVARIADRAGDFYEIVNTRSRSTSSTLRIILSELLRALPEIVFTLRAVSHPSSIPLSLASLNLITQTTQSFTYTAFSLVDETGSISDKLGAVRLLYEVTKIPNRIQVHPSGEKQSFEDKDQDDPTLGIPFPEDAHDGITIHFDRVSFRYPSTEQYALRNISFHLPPGALLVILGPNGSGKSTILKLLCRIYDPSEGVIRFNGVDIRTMRSRDLKRAVSVLFQDCTVWPLSIRDNISLGAPSHSSLDQEEKIHRAATLGGAYEFISRLPQGYDTYIERPVMDYYGAAEGVGAGAGGSGDGDGGRRVDYSRVRRAMAMGGGDGGAEGAEGNMGLSGGQMQRIALSRTFMRTLLSPSTSSSTQSEVGLLLFDEPSASLDPSAEHDLFERLRELRGHKTMVFSSHRFGNLTRRADLILYMKDAVVVEEGTHDELLRKDGEYARIWNLQARAFL